jgi:hypothetical protein
LSDPEFDAVTLCGVWEFRVDEKPYKEVLIWVAEKSNKPFLAPSLPPGSFTFFGQPGAMYSMPQIIEIINRDLRPVGYEITTHKEVYILDEIRQE